MDPSEVIQWVAAIGGTIGLGALIDRWWTNRLLNRPGRAGTKVDAETMSELAEAKFTLAQADSEAVKAIKEALQEVRALSSAKDLQIVGLQSEMGILRGDVKNLQQQGHRVQVALAAHGQWDLIMLAELRQHRPDFPEPPPLGDFDLWVDAEKKRNGEISEN